MGLRGSIGGIPALSGVPLGGSSIIHSASPGSGDDGLRGDSIWADSRVGMGQKVLGSPDLGE